MPVAQFVPVVWEKTPSSDVSPSVEADHVEDRREVGKENIA